MALIRGASAAPAAAPPADVPAWVPIVGYRYRSSAVIGDGPDPDPHQGIELLERPRLDGSPGTRVPHVWLEQRGRRISTLDLTEGGFVLLTGSGGGSWCEASRAVSSALGVDLSAHRAGEGGDLLDVDGRALPALGISADGAVLVRPDSFVGWRCAGLVPAPDRTLEDVLSRILGRR
jgi:hypothetical protein